MHTRTHTHTYTHTHTQEKFTTELYTAAHCAQLRAVRVIMLGTMLILTLGIVCTRYDSHWSTSLGSSLLSRSLSQAPASASAASCAMLPRCMCDLGNRLVWLCAEEESAAAEEARRRQSARTAITPRSPPTIVHLPCGLAGLAVQRKVARKELPWMGAARTGAGELSRVQYLLARNARHTHTSRSGPFLPLLQARSKLKYSM